MAERKRNLKIAFSGGLAIFFILISSSLFSADKIIAVLNNEVITEKEIRDYLNMLQFTLQDQYQGEELLREYRKEKEKALDVLIEQKLIIQEAKRKKIEIPQEWIDKKLDTLISGFKNHISFEEYLADRGLTIDKIKQIIKNQLLVRQIINEEVSSHIKIFPSEVTSYYKEHFSEFYQPQEISYIALKFKSKYQVYQVYEEVRSSSHPEEVFEKYKDKSISGKINKEGARDELKGLFRLNKGAITEPIKIDEAFYIFRILEKKPQKIIPLSEVKETIWRKIYKEKFNKRLKEWINSLKEKAYIKIVNPLFE